MPPINPECDFRNPPKFLTYKALLSQWGETPPTARVLNFDDNDFLGECSFEYSRPGEYLIILPPSIVNDSFRFKKDLISFLTNNQGYVGSTDLVYTVAIKVQDDSSIFLMVTNDGTPSDDLFKSLPIEIKVRQRGVAPRLLSAETNEEGTAIHLIFDKDMNPGSLGCTFGIIELDGYASVVWLSGSSMILDISGKGVNSESVLSLSLQDENQSLNIESMDYGFLDYFSGFPVVNKCTVAPE